ncbi:MAG: chloride channel protein [Chloroflexota bacterium]|nr:chloride channel protein [Chloroflexota bacterium]
MGKKRLFYATELTFIFWAFLLGPLVGLSIALLKWSIPKLAGYLSTLPFNPAVVFALASVSGSLIMGRMLEVAPRLAGPGIGDATWIITGAAGKGAWYWWPLKLFGTILCVGTGGGGLVGPSFFSGTATGVTLGKWLGVKKPAQLQALALLGAGAGVGAVLKAPLGGVIVALEALGYQKGRGQLALRHTVAALLTSLLAYLTLGGLLGFAPILQLAAPLPRLESLSALGPVAAAALLGGLAAKAYIELFRHAGLLWQSWAPHWLQPALGALLTAPIVILLSTGNSSALQPYEIGRPGLAPLQDALLGKLGALALLSLTVGKALDVGIRAGSEGTVGIFGPAMWVGGLGGALVGFLPSSAPDPLFAVAGIAAGIAAAMEFPLAAMVITVEIFGRGATLPAMLGGIIGALVWRHGDRLGAKAR